MLYMSEWLLLPITTLIFTCHKHVNILYQCEAKNLNFLIDWKAENWKNFLIFSSLAHTENLIFIPSGPFSQSRSHIGVAQSRISTFSMRLIASSGQLKATFDRPTKGTWPLAKINRQFLESNAKKLLSSYFEYCQSFSTAVNPIYA